MKDRSGGAPGAGGECVGLLFPGALGDAVCLEPTVDALARSGPIVLYARGAAARVAELFPSAPLVRSLDRPEIARLFAPRRPDEEREPDAAHLLGVSRIVSFTGARDPQFCARLARCAGSVVLRFPREPGEPHFCDRLLRAALGDPTARARPPRLRAPGRTVAGAELARLAARGPVLAIHPGAGHRAKRAPRALLLELAQRWRSRSGGPVAIVLGPAEQGEASAWRPHVDAVIEPTDAVDLAGTLTLARAFVGNDSGPTHLAAALGVAGAALFRESDPRAFGPRSDRLATVVLRGANDALEAWSALVRALP